MRRSQVPQVSGHELRLHEADVPALTTVHIKGPVVGDVDVIDALSLLDLAAPILFGFDHIICVNGEIQFHF